MYGEVILKGSFPFRTMMLENLHIALATEATGTYKKLILKQNTFWKLTKWDGLTDLTTHFASIKIWCAY